MPVTTTSATATGWAPAKIAEMLRWCQETGIELATVYLLSTENLQRHPDELASLIEIITDVVEEICAPVNRWSVRTVGDLELIGEEPARRLRDAVESTNGNGSGFHVNLAVGYGGRQEIVDAVRALLGKQLANGATGTNWSRPSPSTRSRRTSTPPANPTPTWSSAHRGSSGCPDSCCGRAPTRRCGSPRRYWPAFRRVDFLRALRDYTARHRRYGDVSHGCAVSGGVHAQLVVGPVPAGP